MSRLKIRLPVNLETLETWTVITDSPMAATVELAAFDVKRGWTISGRDFSRSLKSLSVRNATRAMK